MFLTVLNLLNLIFKFSINYINFFNKLNNFNINILILNTWFYIYIIFLKYNSLFYKSLLIDINTFDYNKKLFLKINTNCIIYNFYLLNFNFKLNIISIASNENKLNSISTLFNNASWIEREISEMFGINFLNKMDSRNLLLDYSYIGYPLLKIFPVTGHVEIYYNFLKNWIIYINVILKESHKIEFYYY